MKKIDLMIIGAQKAATTSLKNYLAEHPTICTHPQKEFEYFQDDNSFKNGFEASFQKYFNDYEEGNVVIAKNAGLYEKEEYIKRLYEHNPSCHLVFLIRNPVDRAFSSYLMEKSWGYIDYDFDRVVQSIENKRQGKKDSVYRIFIGLGLYVEFLKIIFTYFPKKQVHVLTFEKIKNNPSEVCKTIFQILSVDRQFSPNTAIVYNKKNMPKSALFADILFWLKKQDNPLKNLAKKILPYKIFVKMADTLIAINKNEQVKETISQTDKKKLVNYFKPFNEKLSSLTGIQLNHWDEI